MGKYYLLFVLLLCPTLFAIQDGLYGGVNLFAGRGKTSVKTLGVDNNNNGDPTESRANTLSKSFLSPGLSFSYLIHTDRITFAPELYFDFNSNTKSGRFLTHDGNGVSIELREKNRFLGGLNFKAGRTFYDNKVFAYGLLGCGVNYKKYRSRLHIVNGDPGNYVNKNVQEVSLNFGLGGDYFVTESSIISLRVEYGVRPSSHRIVNILDDGAGVDHTNTTTLKSKNNFGIRVGYSFKLY